MPLKINVGLSRKVSQDYQSKGFSLNIEGELAASVIDDPDAMSTSVDQLFELANRLLDEQVEKAGPGSRPTGHNGNGHSNGNGHTNSNGHRNGNGRSEAYAPRGRSNSPTNGYSRANGNGAPQARHANSSSVGKGGRNITQAQSKAISNMAKRLGYDPQAIAHEEFGRSFNELSVKQASDLIDLLRRDIESQPAQGRA